MLLPYEVHNDISSFDHNRLPRRIFPVVRDRREGRELAQEGLVTRI